MPNTRAMRRKQTSVSDKSPEALKKRAKEEMGKKKLGEKDWKRLARTMGELKEWDRRGIEVGIPSGPPELERERREKIRQKEEEFKKKGKKRADIMWGP